MTRKELREMGYCEFAIMVLQEKLDKCYNKSTPLAKKLSSTIEILQRLEIWDVNPNNQN